MTFKSEHGWLYKVIILHVIYPVAKYKNDINQESRLEVNAKSVIHFEDMCRRNNKSRILVLMMIFI